MRKSAATIGRKAGSQALAAVVELGASSPRVDAEAPSWLVRGRDSTFAALARVIANPQYPCRTEFGRTAATTRISPIRISVRIFVQNLMNR
jgi:hypothetical protein